MDLSLGVDLNLVDNRSWVISTKGCIGHMVFAPLFPYIIIIISKFQIVLTFNNVQNILLQTFLAWVKQNKFLNFLIFSNTQIILR